MSDGCNTNDINFFVELTLSVLSPFFGSDSLAVKGFFSDNTHPQTFFVGNYTMPISMVPENFQFPGNWLKSKVVRG